MVLLMFLLFMMELYYVGEEDGGVVIFVGVGFCWGWFVVVVVCFICMGIFVCYYCAKLLMCCASIFVMWLVCFIDLFCIFFDVVFAIFVFVIFLCYVYIYCLRLILRGMFLDLFCEFFCYKAVFGVIGVLLCYIAAYSYVLCFWFCFYYSRCGE